MKMQIVDTKHLGELSSLSFFCKCGRTKAGECSICTPPELPFTGTVTVVHVNGWPEPEPKRSWLERLFPDRWFSVQVIVGIILVIIALQLVFSRVI